MHWEICVSVDICMSIDKYMQAIAIAVVKSDMSCLNNIKFSIMSKFEIWDACKLMLVLKSKVGQSFVLFFYPFDLFRGSFIILLGFDSF